MRPRVWHVRTLFVYLNGAYTHWYEGSRVERPVKVGLALSSNKGQVIV